MRAPRWRRFVQWQAGRKAGNMNDGARLSVNEEMMMKRGVSRYAGLGLMLSVVTCGGLGTFSTEEKASTTVPGCNLGCILQDFGFGGFSNMNISDNQDLKNQGVSKND